MARRTLTGIRKWKSGLQAYVEVRGKTYSKSFARTTPIATMRAWREAERLKHAGRQTIAGSFRADIDEYLSRVKAMPSYKQRAAHLQLWARALGADRSRFSITTGEIERVMQDWLTTPSRPVKGRPSAPEGLAPATVRKRRTALLSLFSKLDGPQASNPVRASTPPKAPKPEARGLDYATIERILAAMPAQRDSKPGAVKAASLARVRVAVLAYTGLPPSLLQTITPSDLRLEDGTVRVKPRRKGAGVEARTLELLPQGVEAFRAFDQAHAYGRFSVEAVNKSFQRACRRANVSGVTLYDLRHSFGALLYRVTKDLATVGRFLLHASTATTERYARAAMQTVDRDAAERAGVSLASATPKPRPKPRRSLSRAPVPMYKSRVS